MLEIAISNDKALSLSRDLLRYLISSTLALIETFFRLIIIWETEDVCRDIYIRLSNIKNMFILNNYTKI